MAKSDKPTLWKVAYSKGFHMPLRGKMKIMKPNQVFSATLEEIPVEFRDRMIPADMKAKETPKPEVSRDRSTPYRIIERKDRDGEYFDIQDGQGKKVNEDRLTKEEARVLLKSLNE